MDTGQPQPHRVDLVPVVVMLLHSTCACRELACAVTVTRASHLGLTTCVYAGCMRAFDAGTSARRPTQALDLLRVGCVAPAVSAERTKKDLSEVVRAGGTTGNASRPLSVCMNIRQFTACAMWIHFVQLRSIIVCCRIATPKSPIILPQPGQLRRSPIASMPGGNPEK